MSSDKIENVLILQGGGSLGVFECGVFKALANNNIKIDIVAGTSIGGLNATIMGENSSRRRTKAREESCVYL
jgi:NTE family protein